MRARGLAAASLAGFVIAASACGTADDGPAAPAAETASAATGLGGTSWQLLQFQGGDDTTLTAEDPSIYTLAFNADGTVAVRVDCNRGTGTWKSESPSQLEFGPLAMTMMACPEAPLATRLGRDFQYMRSYVLRDGHLHISLMADGGIYEFEPLPAGR